MFDYDGWKTGWYDAEPEYECCKCDEKDNILSNIADHMTSVIAILYSNDQLDVAVLEDQLDEVCHLLDIKLPATLPNIERKRSELFQLACDLMKVNNL